MLPLKPRALAEALIAKAPTRAVRYGRYGFSASTIGFNRKSSSPSGTMPDNWRNVCASDSAMLGNSSAKNGPSIPAVPKLAGLAWK